MLQWPWAKLKWRAVCAERCTYGSGRRGAYAPLTPLKSPIAGQFFYLYLIMDVWSRKILAATVFSKESNDYSAKLFLQTCYRLGIDPAGLILHSDNAVR
jgi:transposase InsO family protein